MKKLVLILFSTLVLLNGSAFAKDFKIDTPSEAIFAYFPSPATLRCLNHSNIPLSYRKAFIHRSARGPNGETLEESVTIGISPKSKTNKFLLKGYIRNNDEIIPLKLSSQPFFIPNTNAKTIFPSIKLEDILGLQKKAVVKEKIGNQILNYETFLKTTKGMIGNANYNLELVGQDKVIGNEVKYFLSGMGKIGEHEISVIARDISKDHYEITEKYGPVEVFTSVKVYDWF